MRNPHQKDRLILLIHTHSAVQGQAPPAANGSYFNPSAGRRRCFGGGKARPPSLDAGEIALFPLLVPPLDPLVRANAVHEAARLPGSKKYGNGGAAMSIRAKANISGTCERARQNHNMDDGLANLAVRGLLLAQDPLVVAGPAVLRLVRVGEPRVVPANILRGRNRVD